MRSLNERIIALDIRTRSFGFAVFEGSTQLLHWGVMSFRHGVNAVKMSASKKIAALLYEFCPRALVIRNINPCNAKKRTAMLRTILAVARKCKIPVHFISKGTVRDAFALNAQNKYEVAVAISRQLPELASKLPRKRKIWEGEDYRLSIFDAVAAGLAYLRKQYRAVLS